MNGASNIVGWPRGGGDSFERDDFVADAAVEELPLASRTPSLVLAAILGALALGWVGFVGAVALPELLARGAPAAELALLVAASSGPLVLLGLVYLLFARGSRIETRRLEAASLALRQEQQRLDDTIERTARRLSEQGNLIVDANDALMAVGDDANERVREIGVQLQQDLDILTRHTDELTGATAAARADVAQLLADVPRAEGVMQRASDTLVGVTANAQAAAQQLDDTLTGLAARGHEADAIATEAARVLGEELTRISDHSATARMQLRDAAAVLGQSVDAALARAHAATDKAHLQIEAQSEALVRLVEEAEAALARTGAASAETVRLRVQDLTERVTALDALLASQSTTTAQLLTELGTGLTGLDARFEQLDEAGLQRSVRLSNALEDVDRRATTLLSSLHGNGEAAEQLVDRAKAVVGALDDVSQRTQSQLPALLASVEEQATRSRDVLGALAPLAQDLDQTAGGVVERLAQAEQLLARQKHRLEQSGESAAAVARQVEATDARVQGLIHAAGAELVEAMVRVRETANAAADRAREALTAVIPDATRQLSEEARDALSQTLTEEVSLQLRRLAETTESALGTAHAASDRLMRQMVSIADTSAKIDERIAEARADIEERDRDNFARRVTLLIEALNSTAIDVAKMLSTEVTDSAWQAYLRGDRGVFTRRAVALLDKQEAKTVAQHYEHDPEFREQVNRYIHDFEAMLRQVLATRDASTLGVALLSSDTGKLYVALAQAVERLRL